MTKISVIIPVYNVENYLDECLKSLINQTFQDFEVILVDDGSTDNSTVVIKKYTCDSRFKLFNLEHKGAYNARNFGLSKAKGEYIQFLDSDDFFEPDMFQISLSAIEKFDTDYIVFSTKKVDEKGSIIEQDNPNFPINLYKIEFNKVINPLDFKDEIFSLFTPLPWNKLFKKEFLIKNDLLFPPLEIYEDVAFCHKAIICAQKIAVIQNKLVNYRFNRLGSLAQKRSNKAIEVVKSCLFLKDFLIEKGLFDEFELAYEKAFISHIQSELSYCTKSDLEKFIFEFKELLPTEYKNYEKYFLKNQIDFDYLKKIIGNKKVMLWGASLFLRQVLENNKSNFENILGIIDLNEKLWGTKIAGYEIYPPSAINALKPDAIVLTVLSNNENVYESLKTELQKNYPKTELLANIFSLQN